MCVHRRQGTDAVAEVGAFQILKHHSVHENPTAGRTGTVMHPTVLFYSSLPMPNILLDVTLVHTSVTKRGLSFQLIE